MKTIFETSIPNHIGYRFDAFPSREGTLTELLGDNHVAVTPPPLPEITEGEVVRHFTNLSRLNHSVDTGFYPLGSCTMKYNPRVNEQAARRESFARTHPSMPDAFVQGNLEIIWRLEQLLREILGMARVSMQPLAGAHGELTGLLIMDAYHRKNGETRKRIVVPDSSHGTNPASAAMAGLELVQIPSTANGTVDLDALRGAMGPDVAGFMLTNPNTLGLFDPQINEIAEIVHSCGALLYYDGANLNATLGYSRPGDCGFDIVHTNLHKTFATPHGGGGPGAGPVGVVEKLVPFLPSPLVEQGEERLFLDSNRPDSIGRVADFHGNFGVLIRAYTYIMSLGCDGLKKVSEQAVLSANYLQSRLQDLLPVAHGERCMHEFVLTAQPLAEKYNIRAMDIAKRLLDHGIHAPTVYFPLIVPEAMMIEPTETESLQTLDHFVDVMKKIVHEAMESPDILHEAPVSTPVSRLDDTRAAREPRLRWKPE